MRLAFAYDTYQDVRHNLFLYSTPFLIVAGFFAYWLILPQAHRAAVDHALSKLSQETWLLKGFSGITLFAGVAYLLTEILQVHDKWYDRYVIKWRFRYATEFILPRLIHPFASKIGRRFHEVAEANVGTFQDRLYYPYVGDRDTKIAKNKLVRFYEVVTLYWLTQINEIVIIVLFALVAAYRLLGPNDAAHVESLLNALLVLLVLFVLNRAWVRQARDKVRRATNEEIEDILLNHLDDLRQRVRAACQEYGIPFAEGP